MSQPLSAEGHALVFIDVSSSWMGIGAFCYQTYRIGTPNAEVDAKIFPHTQSYKLLKAPGNGRLWEVMTGMKYLLDHLKDRKLFYHAVPDEATEENTHSQVELARGDQTETGRFLLGSGIARSPSIRESQCKAPCQVVVRDNVMMD
uniref:Uncharacterized protein n=1 Tax=Fusarium oxysporum (strain Fo5176) TaxID=660025 RepID=A0A0D2YER8_FUSOF